MSTVTHLLSIPALFAEAIHARPNEPALFRVIKGKTHSYTWSELGEIVSRWTTALHALKVRPMDRVVLWSENRFEWIVVDLALQNLGAIHVPLHNTVSGQQATDQILHSGAQVVILAGNEQYSKISSCCEHLPSTIQWLSFDRVNCRKISGVQQLSELAKSCDVQTAQQLVDEYLESVNLDDPTTIIYSSGTTGEPKGVTLSQRNIVSNTYGCVETFGEQPMDLRVNFLPFSHIFARTADLYTWLLRGCQLALSQNRDTIIDDCKRFKPTLVNGVPYFFERVRQKIVESGKADKPGVLQRVFGGELRGCISGGAALANETYDFFESQGVPLRQGYGLTETSPVVACSTLEIFKRGTVGKPIKDVEVRLEDDGEISVRGPNVMLGYWQDDAATEKVLKDGWFHTGDLGAFDDDGYLTITGRKKEIIVTATGKNIFPSHLEALLCRDPFILQAMVIGTDRKYLSALIVPDPDILKAEIWARRLLVFRRKSAVKHPAVIDLYRERIDRQLAQLSKHEQIQRFKILHRGFLPENGHLTPKLSLRRDLIMRDFARDIEDLYNIN